MDKSKLEQIKDLLHDLLECRVEDKPVIIGLCDRGTENLNKLSDIGPDLIDSLNQWLLDVTNINDGYLTPMNASCQTTESRYQKMVFPDKDEQKADSSLYQPLIQGTELPPDESTYSFSVIGFGSFPAPHESEPGDMDNISKRDSERYVSGPDLPSKTIKDINKGCFETKKEDSREQVHQAREQHPPDNAGSYSAGNLITEFERLKQQYETELAKLRRENKDLSERLSKELSSKVSADESDLENVNIKNRPMNIAGDYTELCSHAWLDAKNELDQHCRSASEEEKLQLLKKILMTSQKMAVRCHERLLQRTELMFRQPLGHLENMERIDSGFMPQSMDDSAECTQFPVALNNAIGDYLRRQADKVDMGYLVEEVKKWLLRKTAKGMHKESEAYSNISVQRYIKKCAVLVWKLQLQRPPMILDDKTGVNDIWNQEKQELYYSSKCESGSEQIVKFYVHPALLHNKAILEKGRVYADSKKNMRVWLKPMTPKCGTK